jgi:phage tail sheath protein FI
MPEYLTPGVYVEETSFRSRSIQGVATNTFGMAGATVYGPVPYLANDAEMIPGPKLITSFTEYERMYGGLTFGDETECQLAIAARGFFANGGRRLYVQRVFGFTMTTGATPVIDLPRNFAALPLPVAVPGQPAPQNPLLEWRARWPGAMGARVRVSVAIRRSKNVLVGGRLTGVLPGAAVETAAAGTTIPDGTKPVTGNVRIVARAADRTLGYRNATGGIDPVAANGTAFHLTFDVQVECGPDRLDAYSGTELGAEHSRSIFTVFDAEDPADESCLVWLAQPDPPAAPGGAPGAQPTPGALTDALFGLIEPGAYLRGGGDGVPLTAGDLAGQKASEDNVLDPAIGLEALVAVDDIALVAMPDTVTLPLQSQKTAVDSLVEHCRAARYRMAIVDPPRGSSLSEVRSFRSQFDSSYAALYYPWLRIVDPIRRPDPGMPPPMLEVPPSGYVAGVFARTDLERGVHKAPANEVVLGVDRFVTNVTFDRQSVLNPEGVNALRFFEGRAYRVWGARTMSSDPEWRYVNVRRLFNYLEHSIDRSTQWAVFEPNNERLWGSIRQSIEDFLLTVWRTGALMGVRPEDAFFVRCDRTTMTQNDLDNGRLICLIGVAPTYPAEFVIFRIGQMTASSRQT